VSRTEFFDIPKPWSRRKHRLHGKNIQPFSATIGNRAGTVYCVDCYAGKAMYGGNSIRSPLILAHQADKAAGWSKPVYLRLINVEALSENFESLRYYTQDERTLTMMTY
jgi:hypothetical protein